MNRINPMEMIQLLRQSNNPQQLVLNLIKERGGNENPFFANLLALGEQGKQDEILAIARNTMREQGRDFDKEFMNFRKILGF